MIDRLEHDLHTIFEMGRTISKYSLKFYMISPILGMIYMESLLSNSERSFFIPIILDFKLISDFSNKSI